MSINPVALITKKRNGEALTADEVRSLVRGFLCDEVRDYQMSAWLMAALLRGMSDEETLALMGALLHSGKVLELRSVKRAKVDKHSTGGVGDKISLCLAPAVAACGIAVPMVSGRGLGHTGGTLDKLEAIPGYSTRLDARTFERVVAKVGVSMIGQTREIAPADARLYALRDVTATVESIPLIVASILSKKLAEGIDGLLLDVKVGCGAFMKDLPSARRLARMLVSITQRAGKTASALLTDMSTPIGHTIGNAIETREAIEVLAGGGPSDTIALTVALGAEMLVLGGAVKSSREGGARIRRALRDGSALDVFRRMVEAHGGDPRVADDPRRLPTAPHRVPVLAEQTGTVIAIDALALGLLGVTLGAGRIRADQEIDPAVGIELAVDVGDRVERKQPLAFLHVRQQKVASAWTDTARAAFRSGRRAPRRRSRVIERIG